MMINRYRPSLLAFAQRRLCARAVSTSSTGIWRRPSTLERELPVADAEALDPIYKVLMNEVRDYDRLFKEIPRHPWWRRKSGLEVLSLLLIHDGEKYHSFRGSNIEPSTPTGSLCAERLSIGRAVCDLPNIKRSDFRAIAVWCPGEDDDDDSRTPINPIAPCGVCMEWLKKIVEESEQFFIVAFTSTSLETMIVTYNHEETEVIKSYKGERKCIVCGRFLIVSSTTTGLCDCEFKAYNAMNEGSREILNFLMGRKKRVTLEGIVNHIRENGQEPIFSKPLVPSIPHLEEIVEEENEKLAELQKEIDTLKAQQQDSDSDSEEWKELNQLLHQLKSRRKKQKQLKKVRLEKTRRKALEKKWPTSLLLEKVDAIVEELHSHPVPLVEKTWKRKNKGTKEVLKLNEVGRLVQDWKLKEKRSELLNQIKPVIS